MNFLFAGMVNFATNVAPHPVYEHSITTLVLYPWISPSLNCWNLYSRFSFWSILTDFWCLLLPLLNIVCRSYSINCGRAWIGCRWRCRSPRTKSYCGRLKGARNTNLLNGQRHAPRMRCMYLNERLFSSFHWYEWNLNALTNSFDHLIRACLTGRDTWFWHGYGHLMLWQVWKENWQARSWVTASLNKGRFAANYVGKAKPLRFSGKLLKTPEKIVPVNDVNLVCRVCFVRLCPGAAGSPCKCEN